MKVAKTLRGKIKQLFLIPGVFGMASLLGGCDKSKGEKYVERPAEQLYMEGRNNLLAGEYEKASKAFDEVERQHPYSDWAVQAQILSAYSYYRDQSYDKALGALDTFIQLHPAHPDIPYAHYLQGLCYYEQLSPVERDQKITELALESFTNLLKRFPESKYSKDARLKIHFLENILASKEIDIGRYYQKRGSHLAAMKRFRNVIEYYQTTSQVEEALHRLIEVYLSLGLTKEAMATGAIFGHNYPGSPWYAESYYLLKGEDFRAEEYKKEKTSWLEQTWIGQMWKKDSSPKDGSVLPNPEKR